MTRIRCSFLGSEVPSPCPRKTLKHGCVGCQDAILERASILQYGQGTGWHDEKDPHKEGVTARTREESDRMAREPVVAELRWFGTQERLI
jgi:hypothetical protein